MTRVAAFLYPPEHDRIVRNVLGLILSGALILGWAGLKLTPKKIGA